MTQAEIIIMLKKLEEQAITIECSNPELHTWSTGYTAALVEVRQILQAFEKPQA